MDLTKTAPDSGSINVEEANLKTEDGFTSSFIQNPETEKRLRRQFDFRVLPLGILIYLLSYIDRTNMGNAKILGLTEDTELVGSRYNIALTLFYVSYVIFEIPSNMMCKHVGPRIWLAFITFGFGVTTFCTSFVNNYKVLYFIRFLLGAFEAGIQPGIMYSYSQFYRRHEMVGRWGIKAAMASVAGSFGGLLSAGLSNIPRRGLLNRWRWVFFFEGLITMLFAGIVYAFLPASAERARFLDEEDKEYAAGRINEEMMMRREEHITWKAAKKALLNVNAQLSTLALICSLLTMTSLSFYMPTVLNAMGYSSTRSQLMSVPPYTLSALVCVSLSMLSDRLKNRGYILLALSPLVPIGFVILATVPGAAGVRYFAIFLSTSGAFTLSPILLAWGVENSAGPAVRAITAAYLVGFGSIGAMISTWTYRAKDAPQYLAGHWTNFAFGVLGGLVIAVLVWTLKRENKARAEGKRDHRLQGASEEVEQLGHLHPGFRYTT